MNPQTGEIERPWRQRDGMFVLADPTNGAERHHKEKAILVDSYSEALELVRKGFSIRMSDGRNSANLISPSSLEIIDEPVKHIDELWNYTMPEVPFTLDEVLGELRLHLQSQASDLYWIANEHAASEFIGFAFDASEHSECEEARGKIDLDRFNITRITRAAYAAAFRPWPSYPISEEDVDELEQILGASLTRFGRRHYSPLENEESALFRTLMSAYYRWQIWDGCFLGEEVLDKDAFRALTILTGMSQGAIRNSLSREGISTVKGKLDYAALLEWLKQRNGFVPLREDEQPVAHHAYRHASTLKSLPTDEAFKAIRKSCGCSGGRLDKAEAALKARLEGGEKPTDRELRDYAKEIGVRVDLFILAMRS